MNYWWLVSPSLHHILWTTRVTVIVLHLFAHMLSVHSASSRLAFYPSSLLPSFTVLSSTCASWHDQKTIQSQHSKYKHFMVIQISFIHNLKCCYSMSCSSAFPKTILILPMNHLHFAFQSASEDIQYNFWSMWDQTNSFKAYTRLCTTLLFNWNNDSFYKLIWPGPSLVYLITYCKNTCFPVDPNDFNNSPSIPAGPSAFFAFNSTNGVLISLNNISGPCMSSTNSSKRISSCEGLCSLKCNSYTYSFQCPKTGSGSLNTIPSLSHILMSFPS